MSEGTVKGWFVTTGHLVAAGASMLTIIGGMYFFFSVRDTSAAVNADRVRNNTARIDRLEQAIYGPNGLNEKFTDVQSKLAVIANILEGRKESNK